MAADSTRTKDSRLNVGIQFIFLNQTNWQGNYQNNISFSTDVDYNLVKSTPVAKHFYTLNFELGFTRFVDSIWQKHIDILKSNYIWKAGSNRWSKTASSTFNTSVLRTYEYSYNNQSGALNKQLASSAFSPSSIDLGFGSGYTFWKQSIVNLSIATARFRMLQQKNDLLKDKSVMLAVAGRNKIFFDYGISFQYKLNREISKKLEFSSNGNVFVKAFNRDNVEMSLMQNWMLKITTNLHLKADIKILYAPSLSYKLQYRNEFLIGFYYDSSK